MIVATSDRVLVVDAMRFRRTVLTHFLKEWAAAEKVELLSLQPSEAHEALRDGIGCRMVIFNAGVQSCSNSETLAAIGVLRVLAPEASLVVVADDEQPDDVIAVMQRGAEGYLSSHSAANLALSALSFLLHGGTYFPRNAIVHLPFPDEETPVSSRESTFADAAGVMSAAQLGSTAHFLPSASPILSERQMAISELLCRGQSNKMIGRTLNLPESTVKVHVREIMRKLSVSNRTQVAVVVSKMGVVSWDKTGKPHRLRDCSESEEMAAGVTAPAPPTSPADPTPPELAWLYGTNSNKTPVAAPLRRQFGALESQRKLI
jgi:DNA-binding NarL/FixJ family response regulator